MEPLTSTHLTAAREYRELAEFLASTAPAQPAPPPRWVEWTTVIAFYSAVHVVNTYL